MASLSLSFFICIMGPCSCCRKQGSPHQGPSIESPQCQLPLLHSSVRCVCTWLGVSLLNSHYFRGKSHEFVSSPRGPSAGLSAVGPTAHPRSRSGDPEAVPYLEGLASSLCDNFDEGPASSASCSPDCDAPDDTSDSSSVVSWGREPESQSGSPLLASPGVPSKLAEEG